MENSMIDIKNELIEWIENSFDSELLQKLLDVKKEAESSALITDINSEIPIEDDFDQQFAAGMTSDELMENIATHLESLASEEPTTVVSDTKSDYAVKDDFDERFAKGLTPTESRERTRQFISNLPWKK